MEDQFFVLNSEIELNKATEGFEVVNCFKSWEAWKVFQNMSKPNEFLFIWLDDSGYRAMKAIY